MPAIYLMTIWQKFGFKFDHIYAYEIKRKDPNDVFHRLPDNLKAAYHWINVGVDSDPNSGSNPLKMILDNYNEDDFIIIKLDIDTPFVEMPLAYQLLEDDRFGALIDSFYFEHHVHLHELRHNWRTDVAGSVKDSLQLFHALRQKGIPSHFWV